MELADGWSLTAALTQLRTMVDRLRHVLSAQRQALRWVSVLVGVLGFVAMGYWAATSMTSAGDRFISPSRKLSSEDLIRICRALDEQRIEYHQDDHRVKVAGDQYDQAAAIVAKLELGQHPIVELRDQGGAWQFLWETQEERRRKDLLTREKILESLIGRLDGVVWSLVSLHHVYPSPVVHTVPKASAFVYIESEGDRQLPAQTIQSIAVILTGFERGLTVNSVTIMDRRGHMYLHPGSLALCDASRNHAEEEDLTEKILRRLSWISGVRVLVRVGSEQTDRAAPSRVAFGAASDELNHEHHQQARRAGVQPPQELSGTSSPTIRINQPLMLDGESSPARQVVPVTENVTETPKGLLRERTTRGDFRPADQPRERGKILVDVPRSFYYNALINRTDQRAPSPEDMDIMASRTDDQIKQTVRAVVPEPAMWDVHVDTIPDDVPLRRALHPHPSPERGVVDPRRVAAVGAGVSIILAAAGLWVRFARRLGKTPKFALKNLRSRTDSSTEPSLLERVQEIIRLDPEAAASVLQRWTAQGR